MKKSVIVFCICFCSVNTFSQSGNYQKFKTLSSPKKWWVLLHPFKAKKTLVISKEVVKIADSIKNTNTLDGDASGGQVDAFRHAFWMASLRLKIGKPASRAIGKAHEKENYQYFKENKLEDGIIPDKASMEMDLYNNDIGLSLVKKREKISKKKLIKKVVLAIRKGRMKVIKKDKEKRFLTCSGRLITKESLRGNWINTKCLVNSDQIAKRD